MLQLPGALDDVPLTMVTTVEQLQEMSKVLTGVTEFAVDLEVSWTLLEAPSRHETIHLPALKQLDVQ